ncbi:50S ribosomal protein L31e [Candidatus Nitrosotalea bavarica]|uniref:50S ribosomal protein L31e n=1 Tax=Candidatus Nitrosotalea bavarica TaxID=1903277 RepID=UPI000C70137F|nr:50S ribosomal protein L31e [Candidatus Nitrosotalea bavarica]
MSTESLERIYTINLGKVLLSPNNQRAKRAINMIREFATKHMKSENIKIEEEVSHLVWARGIRHPPRKIRVKITKDDGNVIVSKYQEEKTVDETSKKGDKKSEGKSKKGDKKSKGKSKKSDEKSKGTPKKDEKKVVEEKKTEEKPAKEETKTVETPKKVEEKKTDETPKKVEEKKSTESKPAKKSKKE